MPDGVPSTPSTISVRELGAGVGPGHDVNPARADRPFHREPLFGLPRRRIDLSAFTRRPDHVWHGLAQVDMRRTERKRPLAARPLSVRVLLSQCACSIAAHPHLHRGFCFAQSPRAVSSARPHAGVRSHRARTTRFLIRPPAHGRSVSRHEQAHRRSLSWLSTRGHRLHGFGGRTRPSLSVRISMDVLPGLKCLRARRQRVPGARLRRCGRL